MYIDRDIPSFIKFYSRFWGRDERTLIVMWNVLQLSVCQALRIFESLSFFETDFAIKVNVKKQ